jgi:DNA-binding transcriptional ArsR family regulator
MVAPARNIDSIFKALGDPTRRKVMERLYQGPASLTELSQPFDMALPSFYQHVRVLQDCGLVQSKKQGRVRTYTATLAPVQAAEDWLSRQRKVWQKRLDQFDNYVLNLKSEQEKQP